MHHLMLVTTTLKPDDTSDDIRSRVYHTLLDDTTFCGDGGRFGSPECDWFVIGGRWSGWLTEMLTGKEQQRPDDDCGAEDDAMIVTRELFERVLHRFSGQDIFNGDHSVEYVDLENEECDESFVGRKWLIVVDCHN